MKKRGIKGGVILLLVSLASATPAWADMIYFKSGGTVEGIVQKENDKSVIIDLGAGTMTVRPDEIERIERSSGEDDQRLVEEKKANEISRGEWAPLGCEEIRIAYLRVKDNKESLEKAKSNSLTGKEEILEKEKKISELLKTLDGKSRELKTIDSDKRTKEYNAVVAEMNSLNARLDAENNELKDLYAAEKKLNTILAEKAGKYRASLQNFKDALKKKQGSANNAEVSGDELSFFEEMNRRALEAESDFKKDVVGYTSEENQVIVDTLINNIVLARMVVDTGASIVVISQEIAVRLGISEENTDMEIEIVMANGTTANARPVILKSVKVGDAEVKNVQAAILENNVTGSADGLLGMSFLSNFVISVDTSSNKLILEQIL